MGSGMGGGKVEGMGGGEVGTEIGIYNEKKRKMLF